MGRVLRCAQQLVFCMGTLLMVTGTMYAQDALPIPAPSTPHYGIPEDWSTQHVIYTRNGSVEDMLKVRDDPRFLNNILLHYIREHRNQTAQPATAGLDENRLSADSADADSQELPSQLPRNWRIYHHPPPSTWNRRSKVDWAVSLGGLGGLALAESPAKYSFNPSAAPSCANDFVVYTLNAAPTVGGQANLVGLRNLYSNSAGTGYCTGTGPTFLFSYAIGSKASALSPTLSLDGTKVAWLENTNPVNLHVTTWVAGQGTSAATGAVAPTGTWSNGACTPAGASCDFALSYTTSAGCTASSSLNSDSDMYIDYPSDTGYVSADNGILYKITGIFKGTPTVDFCVTVNGNLGTKGAYMSGAVYDPLLNEVFVSDSSKVYAYSVGATSFTLTASYTYAASEKGYAAQAPVLDAFNGYIYMYSTDDINGDTSVAQLPTSLASAVFVALGPASTTTPNVYLSYGAFDNNYYNKGPKNAASTLYSCGTDTTTTTAEDLFAISFNASTGLMNTTPVMPANKNVNPGGHAGICSPIIEFYAGSTDRIFVGMGDFAGATTGANVVTMWNVTTRLTSASATPTATATGYQGGTTGFAIDNNASPASYPQAESVYFSTLNTSASATTCGANNYCAVKLTQSALQ